MATQAVYLKEYEGIAYNVIGQPSLVSQTPWWNTFGSLAYADSCVQPKPLGSSGGRDHFSRTKLSAYGLEPGLDKGTQTRGFTISAGDCKDVGDGQKSQGDFTLQPTRFELEFGQPMIWGRHPYMHQRGVLSAFGPQGRIMLPCNLATDEGPIYVNAKQYHGIIRRRQSRAKAELENRASRSRKPYMHYSRHLHATRRPRGSGGRFLNMRNLKNDEGVAKEKKTSGSELPQFTESQSSEVVHPEFGTQNPSKEPNGLQSNLSGSEVTSMMSRQNLVRIPFHDMSPSIHSLMETGRGFGMSGKWVVAAGDGCFDLKV